MTELEQSMRDTLNNLEKFVGGEAEKKYCANCGAELEKTIYRSNGYVDRKKTAKRWAERRYCNRGCSVSHQANSAKILPIDSFLARKLV